MGIGIRRYRNWGKKVSISGCILTSGEDPFALPCDIQHLCIHNCTGVRSLTEISSLQNIEDLERCEITCCGGMETIFHSSTPFEENYIPESLKELVVSDLPDLRDVFSNVTPANATHSNLTVLSIYGCQKLRYIFPFMLSSEFKNLKHLTVTNCWQVEAIIIDEMDDGNIEGHVCAEVSFPTLKSLKLFDLPKLKSIYNGLMRCESLEEIQAVFCYQLRRLPLALRKDNGQILPPTALKKIEAHEDWWESMEWDEPDAKTTLQRFFMKW